MKKVIFNNSNIISFKDVTENNFVGLENKIPGGVTREFIVRINPNNYVCVGSLSATEMNKLKLRVYPTFKSIMDRVAEKDYITAYVFETRQALFNWMAENESDIKTRLIIKNNI